MTDKELIKQEIERRIAEGSSKNDISEGALALESLLDFIDNLQEESGCEADCTTIDEDLEAEIQRYFSEEKWIEKPIAEIAIHFANWQHGKDFDDLLQSEMKFPKEYYERGKADAMKEMKEALQTEYEKGRFDMREEMMKDAVDGEVVYQIGSAEIAPTDIRYKIMSDRVYIPNVKLGDKVKIIIIKEEQQ